MFDWIGLIKSVFGFGEKVLDLRLEKKTDEATDKVKMDVQVSKQPATPKLQPEKEK